MPSPRPKSSETDGIREVEEAIYLMCPPMAVATAIRAFATPAPGAFGSELFLNGCLETAQHDSVSRRELFLESPPLVLLDVIGIPEHLAGGAREAGRRASRGVYRVEGVDVGPP